VNEILVDGGLWLAMPIALAAGLLSFLSPCVLPLVPGYLGYVSGVAGGAEKRRSRMVLGALLFILGFTVVFVVFNFLGAATSVFYLDYVDVLQRIGGIVVILLGLVFIGQVTFLQRTIKPSWQPRTGLIGAPLLGVVFALGWSPCLGPTMATVFLLSSFDPARAVVLAIVYCLGLGIPFVLVALGLGWVTTSIAWVKRHIRVVNIVGGVLLIVVGLLLVTGVWNALLFQFQAVIDGFVPAL
jgi:cytochrome c-type biogenesis protein